MPHSAVAKKVRYGAARRFSPHTLLLILAVAAAPAALVAQRRAVTWDLSAGFGNGAGRIAAAGWLPFELMRGRGRVAVGLRLSGFGGATREFANRGGAQGALASALPVDPSVYTLNGSVAGEVRVAGLLRHPRKLARLNMLLSVA